MTTASIRRRLHEYIEVAEDKKLKAIYTLLQDDIDDDYQLTEEQKIELDRRSYEYQNGIGKTYTWDETVAMAKQKLKERKSSR
jgi:putative addiction module component (TIGR02574 family)